VYVDNLLITCVNKDVIDCVVNYLEVVFKAITVHHGDSHSYLGMGITFIVDKANLSMKGYVDQLLQQYDITKGVNTPTSNDLFVIRSGLTLLNDDLREYFLSVVAKLLLLLSACKLIP
jgi:hypothetical protein